MRESLVDADGYPRNDIDVYQVRHARHQINTLQNDLKSLMKEIEKGLEGECLWSILFRLFATICSVHFVFQLFTPNRRVADINQSLIARLMRMRWK